MEANYGMSTSSRKVEIPIYSFTKHQREKETTPLYPPRVLILEGILAFTDPRIFDMLDMKVCLLWFFAVAAYQT